MGVPDIQSGDFIKGGIKKKHGLWMYAGSEGWSVQCASSDNEGDYNVMHELCLIKLWLDRFRAFFKFILHILFYQIKVDKTTTTEICLDGQM